MFGIFCLIPLTFHHCLNLSDHLIVYISLCFYGMRSCSCFYIKCVCLFFVFYGQNVSASFLCLSCPALVLVLIMCASSCSADLSK